MKKPLSRAALILVSLSAPPAVQDFQTLSGDFDAIKREFQTRPVTISLAAEDASLLIARA